MRKHTAVCRHLKLEARSLSVNTVGHVTGRDSGTTHSALGQFVRGDLDMSTSEERPVASLHWTHDPQDTPDRYHMSRGRCGGKWGYGPKEGEATGRSSHVDMSRSPLTNCPNAECVVPLSMSRHVAIPLDVSAFKKTSMSVLSLIN